MDLKRYRLTESEQARTGDLLRLLPRGGGSVLEVGARDGYFSRLLAEHFEEVVALDLEKPAFAIDRVTPVQGDVRSLDFPDDFFDCVFCTEVLEHVPELERAAAEISRVARRDVVIGVPYRQDTRLGRTTCLRCGAVNPPWGHVHSFDEKRLEGLFPTLRRAAASYVWRNRERTNPVSAWLMDRAGNPWGTYHQEEPCIHCGAKLAGPPPRSLPQKVCSSVARRLNGLQRFLVKPWPNWIHMVFTKRP
jgi:SAM-dependent methyltransferase